MENKASYLSQQRLQFFNFLICRGPRDSYTKLISFSLKKDDLDRKGSNLWYYESLLKNIPINIHNSFEQGAIPSRTRFIEFAKLRISMFQSWEILGPRVVGSYKGFNLYHSNPDDASFPYD